MYFPMHHDVMGLRILRKYGYCFNLSSSISDILVFPVVPLWSSSSCVKKLEVIVRTCKMTPGHMLRVRRK
jgi:hypothetical protein